jgi:arylformamidase
MIHDITIPLNPTLAVWPGDTEFAYITTAWGEITVGAVTMSCHSGTHADAPRHFLPGGAGMAEIPPEVYVGECLVIEATERDTLDVDVFVGLELPHRVLIKTLAWTDHSRFPTEVPTLTEAAVEYLRDHHVWLLGMDVPSVDRLQSKDLPIHHALADANIHILESLDLRRIPPGRYQLIALPLRLDGADGSPVRAVLTESLASQD